MSLDVINYQSNKTVKLSDAFLVEIQDRDKNGNLNKFKVNGNIDSSVLESGEDVNCLLHNVISVKLPNLKTTIEQMKYNCYMHNFIRLNLENAPETVDITLFETSDQKVKKIVNYLLEKTGFNENFYGEFNPFNTLSNLNIYILDNSLTKSVFVYSFGGLKLINYDYPSNLDYKDSSLPQVNLSFSFKEFSYGPYTSLNLIEDSDVDSSSKIKNTIEMSDVNTSVSSVTA